MSFTQAQENRTILKLLFLLLVAPALFFPQILPAAGAWSWLVNYAPNPVDTMLLLPDGTVMATDSMSNWFRLTPDEYGSYVNGTWSTLAPMHYSRLYFASDVLPDGRVFVAGGEYGNGSTSAEIYDPASNTWTLTSPSGQDFSDCISTVLPDGTVLIAPVHPSVSGNPVIYDPASDTWSTGPEYFQGNGPVMNQDESSWVKLPDDSILTVDPASTNSERYIPALDQWIGDAAVPVPLYDMDDEIGPALLLPNGQAFFMGATGYTALYGPCGTTNAGAWSAGPGIPDGVVAQDNPCAMMVNGKILCAFGPEDYTTMSTSFYEYDPVTNAFQAVDSPLGTNFPQIAYAMRMLDLPDGTVLVSATDEQLFIYQPEGSPLVEGKPTIVSISANDDGSYLLTGTLLNGISAGAVYGDDAQMDSNYPLVRMTDGIGDVYYARTANWSSTGVMTGNTLETTQFWLPAGLQNGIYSLVVEANGNSSDPVTFTYVNPLVTPVFAIQRAGFRNGLFSLVWSSIPGQTYHVQIQTDLTATNWTDLVGTITATNYLTMTVDTNLSLACPQKFYRVVSP